MQMLPTYKSHSKYFSDINFFIILLTVAQMSQCIVFCRTNLDCTNLEDFLCAYSGVEKFRGKRESGKEGKYSCCVMAGNYDVKLYAFLLCNAYMGVLSCLRIWMKLLWIVSVASFHFYFKFIPEPVFLFLF